MTLTFFPSSCYIGFLKRFSYFNWQKDSILTFNVRDKEQVLLVDPFAQARGPLYKQQLLPNQCHVPLSTNPTLIVS